MISNHIVDVRPFIRDVYDMNHVEDVFEDTTSYDVITIL